MTHEARITNGADETAAAAATVAQIMTPEIVAVGMDEPLHRIQRTLAEEGFHHLLVVEAGELRGSSQTAICSLR